MNFEKLVSSIQVANTHLQHNAIRAVNINITLRNWLTGIYIVEFEQKGEDRAAYGTQLLVKIAQKIKIKGLSAPELSRCRQFYNTYPHILGSLSQESLNQNKWSNLGALSQQFNSLLPAQISQALTGELIEPVNPQENSEYLYKLLLSASFSHFAELIKIDDPTKRKFYELLILKTTLSVRELQRQINTLTFERFGLSQRKNLPSNNFSKK